MAINVELRKSNGSSFDGDTNLIYIKTHYDVIDGLKDENGKINTSLLPASVLGGLKYIGSTPGGPNNVLDYMLSFIESELEDGDTPVGKYFIHSGSVEIKIPKAIPTERHYLNKEGELFSPSSDTTTSITLEDGDWIVLDRVGEALDGESGKVCYWSIVNNTYHYATLSVYGITKLTNTINGTTDNLAVTPKGVYNYALSKTHEGTGGSVHALATQSVPGFMSPEDKTKSDRIGWDEASGRLRYDTGSQHKIFAFEDWVDDEIALKAKIPIVSSLAEANALPQASIADSLVFVEI